MRFPKIPLMARILIGFVTGTICGLILSKYCAPETTKSILVYVAPFGAILVAMLKAVVYPIILFSLIYGAASLPLRKSGRVGGLVLLWYTATSLFATVFGVLLAYLLNPKLSSVETLASGHLASVKSMAGSAASSSFTDFLIGLFQNPFAALASGQFLPVIVFAIAFDLAARSILDTVPEIEGIAKSVQTLLNVVDGAQRVSFKLIDWVVHYFPIGVFALSVTNFAVNGMLLFGPYLQITSCVVIGVLAMILVIYPLSIALFCRENPFRTLYRLRSAILTAFVTRSSAATLPVSFRTMDELGVDRTLSSFSLPMGATVNMDGVCIHLPVFVILAANMFGHDLTVLQIATLCLSILFASIGAGGIPGGSVFLLFMVLENMGLPPDQVAVVVALALGINPILDMFETSCNVTGDNVCTYIVARKSGLVRKGGEASS
ncbi:MAG: dicarboxylate/amino acid:cation symporter [Kiritimatiellae bacterium]|nr:dicarboxylate/amino acid:cation symporter [Kiritimatiellia bacterium]